MKSYIILIIAIACLFAEANLRRLKRRRTQGCTNSNDCKGENNFCINSQCHLRVSLGKSISKSYCDQHKDVAGYKWDNEKEIEREIYVGDGIKTEKKKFPGTCFIEKAKLFDGDCDDKLMSKKNCPRGYICVKNKCRARCLESETDFCPASTKCKSYDEFYTLCLP